MKFKKFFSFLLALVIVFPISTSNLFASNIDNIGAKIITVSDTVSYLTLDFTKYDKNVKNIYLDGEITDFSQVDNLGKILKTEFNGKHSNLKVEFQDGNVVEKNISNIYKSFPYSFNGKLGTPDVVIGHAVSTVFDFHDIAKNSDGIELKYPKSTTFDISNIKKREIDAVTTPTTTSSKYLRGKDVLITYSFDSDESIKKFNNIKSVNILKNNIKKDLPFYTIKNPKLGKLGLSFRKGEALDFEGKAVIQVIYNDGTFENKNIEVLNEIKNGNPNPKEEVKDTDFDYGNDIVFKYDLTDKLERKKFKSISSVTKVYSNEQESSLNIKKTRKSNIGELRILFSSSIPIQDKGNHSIKINYKGSINSDIKKITYKKTAPEVTLTADSGEYNFGKSIIFNLKGFEYLFQQNTGISTVFLNGKEIKRKRVVDNDENYEEAKAKDENVAENEAENSWHIVGETFRIKNEGIKLLKKGINYLTIKYDGYHDSNLTFVLNENVKFKENSNKKIGVSAFRSVSSFRGVDAVTSGTSDGAITKPIMGGDSDGGGSIAMGFKVAFKFGMIANAFILEKLGYFSSDIDRILNAWEGTSKEIAILKDNKDRKVVWDGYLTFVQKNRINSGSYFSFNEYSNSSKVISTKNSYYLVKYAFPNGFGYPIYGINNIYEDFKLDSYSVEKAKKILDIVKIGEDIVLPLDNWSINISEILLNGKRLTKGKDYFEDLPNSNFVIRGSNFDVSGNINIKIKSLEQILDKNLIVLEREKSTGNIRLRTEEYDKNTVIKGNSLKFEVKNNLQLNGISIKIKEKDKYRKYFLKPQDYKYYQSLGLLEIFGNTTTKEGKYTVEFDFAGLKKEKIKFEVFDKKPIEEDTVNIKADFDENEMQKLFPGMIYNFKRQILSNDGKFKDYQKFIKNLKRIELNGERLSFGTTGALITGFGKDSGVTIFKKLKKGDTITIYSNRFEPYKFFVKESN